MTGRAKCMAHSGIGGGDPQECDWPLCGCDPQADRVREMMRNAEPPSPEQVASRLAEFVTTTAQSDEPDPIHDAILAKAQERARQTTQDSSSIRASVPDEPQPAVREGDPLKDFGPIFLELTEIARDVILNITSTPEADVKRGIKDIFQRCVSVLGRAEAVATKFSGAEENPGFSPTGASATVSDDVRDAARYRWLREDNAYFPEEEMIRGGDELDDAIDAKIEAERGRTTR